MSEKKYSWKGSPNAGLVLTVLAGICGLLIFLVGLGD